MVSTCSLLPLLLLCPFIYLVSSCLSYPLAPMSPLLPSLHMAHPTPFCWAGEVVASWTSDQWHVAGSNPLCSMFHHLFHLIVPCACWTQSSLTNVQQLGLNFVFLPHSDPSSFCPLLLPSFPLVSSCPSSSSKLSLSVPPTTTSHLPHQALIYSSRGGSSFLNRIKTPHNVI